MKTIKKTLCSFLTALMVVSAMTPAMANDDIKVKIDGNQIVFDVQPQLINDRTMVPLRAIFEVLGATVDWNNDTETVTSTKDNTTISLTINKPTMYVNGVAVTLDSPACLVNDRTLVPVRAISEAFKCGVDWEETTSTVYITTKPELCINGHELQEASCNSSEKCVKCGREYGLPLGHKSSEFTVTKEPTCFETGKKSYNCLVCGDFVEEDILVLEHNLADWEVIHTETTTGKRVKKCTVCNEICEEEIYQKSAAQMKEDYKWFCPPYNYTQLSRVANVNKGEKIHVKGHIMQSIEDEDGNCLFLVEITKNKYSWSDIVMVYYMHNEIDFKRYAEDEFIDIYGEISGLETYETVGGTQKTVPVILARYIDIWYDVEY